MRNQVFLQVTWAYSELLRAEGRRAAQLQARDEARVIAKLTADYAMTGQGREADANRAATQLARREAYIQAAEARDPHRVGQALPALESRSRRFACIRPTPSSFPIRSSPTRSRWPS